MSQNNKTIDPFYERLAGRPRGKLLLSSSLGLLFLAARLSTIGSKVLTDWSLFLGLLITSAMVALYCATRQLNSLISEMSLRLDSSRGLRDSDGAKLRDCNAIPPIKALSNGNFVCAGIFFGISNCVVGAALGLPDVGFRGNVALQFGFFLAGFVCGMAVWGICGVNVTVNNFSRVAKGWYDYTAPDGCGGVQFIGDGLMIFSSLTLIVGVGISVYIYNFRWTSEEPWVLGLKRVWIIFPYLLSLIVLTGPAVPLNDALRRYKVKAEGGIRLKLDAIRLQLNADTIEPTKREELRKELAYQQNERKKLYAMGTWPHGMSANLKYLGIFLANLLASVATAHQPLIEMALKLLTGTGK